MGRELVGFEDPLHRAQADPHRLGQRPARRPVGGLTRRRAAHQVDDFLNRRRGQRRLAGLARLVTRCKPSTPSRMNLLATRQTTGLALPDRRMISVVPQPSAVARMILARHTCFCGALRSEMIAFKSTAVRSGDGDDNSCSHAES